MNPTNEFLDYAGLQHYDQKARRRIKTYGYEVDEDGVLSLVNFTAGVKLTTADNKILTASNSIHITTKEDI